MFSPSSLPASSASTTRVLSNGTLSQGLWLDRSALAYDVLVGNVRFWKARRIERESTHSEALKSFSCRFRGGSALCLCLVSKLQRQHDIEGLSPTEGEKERRENELAGTSPLPELGFFFFFRLR